jgi:hypothetical protein
VVKDDEKLQSAAREKRIHFSKVIIDFRFKNHSCKVFYSFKTTRCLALEVLKAVIDQVMCL